MRLIEQGLSKLIDRAEKMATGTHPVTVLSTIILILSWYAAAGKRDHINICLMSG